MLRVSPRTIRRLGADGELQRVRIGRRIVRYRADSVEALITPAGGVSSSTIKRIEDREVRPHRSTLATLARALGCNSEALVDNPNNDEARAVTPALRPKAEDTGHYAQG